MSDRCNDEKIRQYPNFLSRYYFQDKIDREEKIKSFFTAIPPNSIVLEGACGKTSKISKCNTNNSNIKLLVGVDLLEDAIRVNNSLDFKIVANLEHLPFKRDYFDVVNLPGVVEHLQTPHNVFKEVNYVLKKGGVLLIGTQNIFNPIMNIQRLLPLKARYWIKKKILKIQGHYLDTFPAPYRCNSPIKIKKVLGDLGFKEEQILLFGWPLMSTPAICLFFSMIYERLTDKKWLKIFKPILWVRFRKI